MRKIDIDEHKQSGCYQHGVRIRVARGTRLIFGRCRQRSRTRGKRSVPRTQRPKLATLDARQIPTVPGTTLLERERYRAMMREILRVFSRLILISIHGRQFYIAWETIVWFQTIPSSSIDFKTYYQPKKLIITVTVVL